LKRGGSERGSFSEKRGARTEERDESKNRAPQRRGGDPFSKEKACFAEREKELRAM